MLRLWGKALLFFTISAIPDSQWICYRSRGGKCLLLDGPRHTDSMTSVNFYSTSSPPCILLFFRGFGKLDGLPQMMVRLAASIMGRGLKLWLFIFPALHLD